MSNIFNKNTIELIHQIKEKYPNKRIGFTCSCFDILHCGHIIMLKDAKSQCDILVIGLQTDPTIDRKTKNKPIQEYHEREIMVSSIKYIDEIIKYATEDDLIHILKELQPNVRILGTDHQGKPFTGNELDIPIYWHLREHNWSTSQLRVRIYQSEKLKNLGYY